MFLAVCFRETDDDMLDKFEEEVSNRGEMTEAKKEMFSQLKAKTDSSNEASKEIEGACAASKQKEDRRVNAPWWMIEEDRNSEKIPDYCYNSQSDTWSFNLLMPTQTNTEKKEKKSKLKCVMM